MGRNPPVIGIDLDDVLWDLLQPWLVRYNEIANDNVLPSDVKSWTIEKYINKGTKEMLLYILEQNDFWKTVNPRPDSQKYLQQLINDGYNVVIVTASCYKTLKGKMARLFELYPFINPSQIIITEQKQLVDLDLLVDDNPNNLYNSKYKKVLFSSYHNLWCNEDDIGAVRVKDWKELYEYIAQEFVRR